MTRNYLISAYELKEYTTIRYSVEDKLLENSILDAQKIDIQPILGTKLYEKVVEEHSGDTISGDYLTLLTDYIEPALIKAAEKRALLFVYAKIAEKGVVSKNDQGASTVEITVLNKLRDEIMSDFGYYSNRLIVFLDNNGDLYPEFSTNTGADIDPSTSNRFFGGFFLG